MITQILSSQSSGLICDVIIFPDHPKQKQILRTIPYYIMLFILLHMKLPYFFIYTVFSIMNLSSLRARAILFTALSHCPKESWHIGDTQVTSPWATFVEG